jgi:hypothetical protein
MPPHDIVRAVRDELATPGLYHLYASPAAVRHSWFWILMQWLIDRLLAFERALASHVKIGRDATSILGDAIVLLCVIAVAAAVAHMLMSLQSEGRRRAAVTPLASRRSAQAIAHQASQVAASGEYAKATRLLFNAAVAMLDVRGIVRDDESATVNELRRQLRQRAPDDEREFAEIARFYSAAAYAEYPLDADAWTRAMDAYQTLVVRPCHPEPAGGRPI